MVRPHFCPPFWIRFDGINDYAMVDHVIIYLSKRKQSAFGKFCLQELKEHIKIFKLSLNLSLTHLRPQIVCYEKKKKLCATLCLRKSFN